MDEPGTPDVAMADSAAAATGEEPARTRRLRLLLSILLLLALLIAADLAGIALDGPHLGDPPITTGSTISIAADGDAFTVSSAVTAMPDCEVPVSLAPGVDRCLVYTVHNPGALPLVVTDIAVASVRAPSACPAEHLDVDRATFTGELAVPAGGTVVAPGVPLALRREAASFDGCRGAVFSMDFTASAHYGALTP